MCLILSVYADVFNNFKSSENEFVCFPRELTKSVTATYNLNRASQLMFPGEEILEEAKTYSYKFLRERQARNQLQDKWVIAKDLSGEVRIDIVLISSTT